MKKSKIVFVSKDVLKNIPAAIVENKIFINKDIWNRFDEFQKKFIIYHEQAHYILQTDDEILADAWALEKLKNHKNFIEKTIKALQKIGIKSQDRYKAIYNFNNKIMEKYRIIPGSPFAEPITKPNFVTGDENDNPADVIQDKIDQLEDYFNRNKTYNSNNDVNGVSIQGYFFSFETIILIIIAIILIKKL